MVSSLLSSTNCPPSASSRLERHYHYIAQDSHICNNIEEKTFSLYIRKKKIGQSLRHPDFYDSELAARDTRLEKALLEFVADVVEVASGTRRGKREDDEQGSIIYRVLFTHVT